MNIGNRVREHRKRKGLSQEQLGAMIGFSQSKSSKIENGNCDSLSDLKLIARALGVRIEELVREEPDGNAPVKEQNTKTRIPNLMQMSTGARKLSKRQI